MAEFTNEANSTAIKDGIATAGQPAEPFEAGICFWDTITSAMYLAVMAHSSGYRCVADVSGSAIKDYSPGNTDLHKAWTIRDMQYWLNSVMQTVTYDYTGTIYTLTILGDDWTGNDADETQALAEAFVSLLNDVNFNDYVA